jgi:MYXO-CTERM domain-containing protein
MPTRSAPWLTAVLATACTPSLYWDLDTPEDAVDDVVVALLFAAYEQDSEEIGGPHVMGGQLGVRVIHPREQFDFSGWDMRSADNAVLDVARVERDENSMTAVLVFTGEGQAELEVTRPNGAVYESRPIEVARAEDAELFAADDLYTHRSEPVGADGTLHVADTSAVSFAVSLLDAASRALSGNGAISVAMEEPTADTDGGETPVVTVEVREASTLRGLDFFDLTVFGDAASVSTLVLTVADEEVRRWDVVVHATSEITSVVLDERSSTSSDEGYVGGDALVGEDRLLGFPLEWRDESGEVLGTGTYITIEEGEPELVTACVPATEVCASTMAPGQLGYVGDGFASICGCQTGGGAGAGLGLLTGLLMLRRRR